jgi:hypothetical protein
MSAVLPRETPHGDARAFWRRHGRSGKAEPHDRSRRRVVNGAWLSLFSRGDPPALRTMCVGAAVCMTAVRALCPVCVASGLWRSPSGACAVLAAFTCMACVRVAQLVYGKTCEDRLGARIWGARGGGRRAQGRGGGRGARQSRYIYVGDDLLYSGHRGDRGQARLRAPGGGPSYIK